MEDNPTLQRPNIPALIDIFNDENAHTRSVARQQLVGLGPQAVPELIEALHSQNWHVRWEAAKTLGEIGSPDAAPGLVLLLDDEDTGVRWAAMGSLTRLGRFAVRPLMELLIHDFHSGRVRQGAHRVLHELNSRGHLDESELRVLAAMEGKSPSIEVPWLASEVLKKYQAAEG